MKKIFYPIISLVAVLGLAGCTDWLEQESLTKVSEDVLTSSEGGIMQLVAKMYNITPMEDFRYRPNAGYHQYDWAGGAGDMENVPEVVLTADDLEDDRINILTALVKSGLEKSRSDARRDVKQGGVTIEGTKITDIDAAFDKAALEKGILIRRGKKSYKRLRFE